MTPQAALRELLARLAASRGAAVYVCDDELAGWPHDMVADLKANRLLVRASPAASAVCPGCERECVMPVEVLPDDGNGTAAFIVCDKRSDINRVQISIGQLRRWRCSTDAVAGFVADAFGLRPNGIRPAGGDLQQIGMVKGKRRSQMLCLRVAEDLTLVAGSAELPLVDLIDFQGSAYTIDAEMIRQLVDSATTADPRHTPNTAKREARKLDTQAMYGAWQKAFKALRKQRRDMSDVWYSKQIAKTPIAKGRDAGTIKKHMKP